MQRARSVSARNFDGPVLSLFATYSHRMRRWICPGTFDPFTNGHLDVVQRAAPHCDELLVAVVDHPTHKEKGLLDTQTRVSLVERATAHLPNVRVMPFTGLLLRFARAQQANGLVRGLRTVTDFEYEFGIGQLNRTLEGGIETFYMLTDPRWSFCSSSAVRELFRYGGDPSPLVPPVVAEHLHDLHRFDVT
jgi:pantetheine-phosphate adenylyltransferase